jgi:hypothetical protein
MPATIAHFVNLIETYHALKNKNESIFHSEPVKKNELRASEQTQLNGKKDSGISQYAFLGAVFPDLPYYNPPSEKFLRGGMNKGTSFAANLFHYNMSGTYAIKLIDYAKGKHGRASAERLMAFILGFISHIACDIVCHPYINTIAGSYWSQAVPFIDKIDVPILPIKEGKVHMHMMTETHQDAWLAINYFGLDDLSSTGAFKSWSDFINDLSLGILIPYRKDDMEALYNDVCNCFKEVYGENLDDDDLWTASNRIFESLDGSYDRALFPFPDKPSMNLVNYRNRDHDYWDYLNRAFTLSKVLCEKAIDYYNGGDKQKKELINYLKNWNLDMGYCISIETTTKGEKIESIHIKLEHCWCQNYGL